MERLREEIARKTADGTLTVEDVAPFDFATAAETAVIMRCDTRTVRAYIKAGKIPATFVGEWRIPCAWLREQAGVAA
jgi:hypothetical protein